MKKFITLKSLKDYKNEELIEYLNNNQVIDLMEMSGIMSEILRRMNRIRPLFPKDDTDWANPLTP